MNDLASIGNRLLISRRDLGIDQKELGRRAKVSNTYISDIERGKARNVGIDVLSSLADALGVSAAYLMGFTDDPLAGVDDPATDAETRRIGEEREGYSALVEEVQGRSQSELRLARRVVAMFLALPPSEQELALDILERLERASRPRIIGAE